MGISFAQEYGNEEKDKQRQESWQERRTLKKRIKRCLSRILKTLRPSVFPMKILSKIHTLHQMLSEWDWAGSQLKAKTDQGGPIRSFSYTQIKNAVPALDEPPVGGTLQRHEPLRCRVLRRELPGQTGTKCKGFKELSNQDTTNAVVCKIKISAKMPDEQNVTILNKDRSMERDGAREKSTRLSHARQGQILPNADI